MLGFASIRFPACSVTQRITRSRRLCPGDAAGLLAPRRMAGGQNGRGVGCPEIFPLRTVVSGLSASLQCLGARRYLTGFPIKPCGACVVRTVHRYRGRGQARGGNFQ